MFISRFLQLVLLLTLNILKLSRGDANTDLHELYREFYSWRLEYSPEFATDVGTYRYNDKLQSYDLTGMDDKFYEVNSILGALKHLNISELCEVDHMNYRILRDVLVTYTSGYKWSMFGLLNPMNFLEGKQLDPVHQIDMTPFYTRGDYENFLVRLRDTPYQLKQYQDLFRTALKMGRTSHNVSVDRVPGQIDKLLVVTERSPFYQPFADDLDGIHMSDMERRNLRDRARNAIRGVLDAFREMKTFLETEYMPNTRPRWGVGSLEHGLDYYKACLKWHLSTDMTPEEVHQIGLQEVDRIVGLMQKVMDRQNFNGSVAAYFAMLKNDTTLHMETEEEVLNGFKKLINERVMPRLPEMFNNLPSLPVKVEAMANDGPLGEYIMGSEDGTRPGIFLVNLFRPKETGTYAMVPITLHESVPGHHLQTSYARKANLPDFRRNMERTRLYEIPYHFPVYMAYVEGWALYAESLGEELGLYQYDHELMGRYSFEMFRACRLVVDTGLHYYGWNREDAISYMLNYTSFSRVEMTIEVDRYITWPGQACAYKIGEIKIKELRKRAEDMLGNLFDIKTFHSVVLENGPMPLHILEEIVNEWITNFRPSTKEEPCESTGNTISISLLMLACILLINLKVL